MALVASARARWRSFKQQHHELSNVIKAVSIIGGATVAMGAALVPASGLIALGAGAACATGLTALCIPLAMNDDRKAKKETETWTNKAGQKIKSTVYDQVVLKEAEKRFSSLFNSKSKPAKLCRKFNSLLDLYSPSLGRAKVTDPGPTNETTFQPRRCAMAQAAKLLKKAFKAAQSPYLTWRMLEALELGDPQDARRLIEKGADLHAEDDFAIGHAARLGNMDFLDFLIENGANVRAGGDRALRTAAAHGRLAALKRLHEKGSDPYAGNGTALVDAAAQGHMGVVKYLVEQGVKPTGPDHPSIHSARHHGFDEIADYLEDNIDWDLHRNMPKSRRVLWSSAGDDYQYRRRPAHPRPGPGR